MVLRRRYIALGSVALLLLIAIGIWGAVFAETPKGTLTVAFLDVGQGDAIFIESPTGVQIVMDGGPDGTVLRELPSVMPIPDRSIDALIGTHPDKDHIGGLIDVFERYDISVYIEPGITKDTLTAQTLLERVKEENIPSLIARRGMFLDLGGGAELHVLFPDYDVSGLSTDDANEGGIVMKLVYGSTTALFMADVSKKVEDRLITLGETDLDTDLLKIGHHGSRFSTDDDFVSAVSPAAAIISVGDRNTYGHPTEEVIHTLSSQHVDILRTDEEGTIIFKSNGKNFVRTK
ncbi:MAG TPA: MBL fold metallo-hydrolase [Candidatus Paceibacterota bacterium]|nr:MBL fold metallo-hydrolase [Candidatus Paceibacterota bacterium]